MSKYVVKGAPFRFNGCKDVSDCETSLEVMQKAHLDWQVDKCPILAKMPTSESQLIEFGSYEQGGFNYNEYDEWYGTYRKDTNTPLGIVKGRYTPVQNTEAFTFFDNAIGKNDAIWQTAGYMGKGESIFVTAKLPNNIYVGDDVTENYLVFSNSHDGSSGVKILFTPIRVICQNMINFAMHKSDNYITFRHTNNVHYNIETAKYILQIANKKVYELQQQFDILVKKNMNDKTAEQIFAKVILTDNEIANITNTGHTIQQIIYRDVNAIADSGVSMKKVNAIAELNNYYYDGIGQKQYVGTGYGVYNAINGFYSNCGNSEGIKRMNSLLYGTAGNKINDGAKLIMYA